MSDDQTTSIYIAGFASGASEDDFKEAFGSYGEIAKVLIRGKDNPFAFVEFTEASAAVDAVAGGDAKIGDADCKVELQTSKPRAKKESGGGDGSSIYIKGIPAGEDVKEKLQTIFGGFGEISNLTYKGRDYAFIEYSSTDGAQAALAGGDHMYDEETLTVEERTSAKKERKPRVKKERVEETGPNTTIYVKGLPEGTETDEIKAVFGEDTKVMNRSNRGFVFITYNSEDEMQAALDANHQWEGAELTIEERTGNRK